MQVGCLILTPQSEVTHMVIAIYMLPNKVSSLYTFYDLWACIWNCTRELEAAGYF